ncbi:MAG: FAD-binding protein [Gaiellaceae bacterium]|jgi:L-aspartate oxidase
MTSPTSRESENERVDLLVIGAGIAGLLAALTVAECGGEVLVVSKGALSGSASYHAQGGIAAAGGEGDSPELHAADTIRAGRGLCRPSAVKVLVAEASARIEDLRAYGVRFELEPGLEGGHSLPRVLHSRGAETGREIELVLARRVQEEKRIRVREGERVLGLWRAHDRCVGAISERGAIAAAATLLATGGAGALWARTTNPSGALGEGIAMAYRAGAAAADLEFVQFHPTALSASGMLLSEALRGAGALLLDSSGERFTDELAPRDVVARAIASRGSALLDLRPIDRGRFPALIDRIREAGYDPATEPVPVAPAAHYTLGGVVTDLDGRSDLPGLYAAGECACTGVHGANRLASNSLLECVVFGRRAGLAALDEAPLDFVPEPPGPVANNDLIDLELRERMWQEAGLVRDAAGLEQLRAATALVPRLVAECALARRESRGVHFRADFPLEDPSFAAHTVLRHGQELVLEPWS